MAGTEDRSPRRPMGNVTRCMQVYVGDQILLGLSKWVPETIFVLGFWILIGIPVSYSRLPESDSLGISTGILHFNRALGRLLCILKPWFPNLSMHQNHPKMLAKHRVQDPTYWVGLR